MSEEKKRDLKLVDAQTLAKWELSPLELRERQLKGAEELVEVMEQFRKVDSDYVRKEAIVLEHARNKIFAQAPPEQWADMAKSLYNQITAGMN